MAIHEAADKADGVVFRCTLSGSAADRWLEVPIWMFDRAACPHPPRLTASPFVSIDALSALSDLLAGSRGEKRERALPSEMGKVYRNMAGLARTSGGAPVHALNRPDTDVDSLMFEISGRLNLSVRTQTELLYKEDRVPDQTEADWLQKRCDALNSGRMPNCPLPRRLEIFSKSLQDGDQT